MHGRSITTLPRYSRRWSGPTCPFAIYIPRRVRWKKFSSTSCETHLESHLHRTQQHRLLSERQMNLPAMRAIYRFEMARTWRTLMQSIIAPVISTSLYFVVFGAAIGNRITEVGGISYGAFIVPGLIMLSLFMQRISNASFGIYFPKFTGTIYELLSAPISYLEITLSYVGAAATKSIILAAIILLTATFFVPLRIDHPFWMLLFLALTALTFSLF